jgi:hypothetical protein
VYASAMPFGPYADFDDCVAQNGDKTNPEAYCAAVEAVAKGAAMRRIRMAVTPVTLQDENGDGIDDVTGEPIEVVDDDDDDEVEEPMIEPDGEEGEDFHALMVLEGIWTGDGRWIEENALTWRDLPLPLMATDRTTEGHLDAILIGTFRRIERAGTEIHGYGTFVKSDDPTVMRLQDLIRNGDLRGVSVDLDAMEYEIVMPAGDVEDDVEVVEMALQIEECPPATQDIALNLENRQNAIDSAGYGPLNPDEPNEEFWQEKADRWSVTIEEARQQRCGSCAVFVKTTPMLSCIEEGLAEGGSSEDDAWAAIDAGDLGYCEAFDFKCAAARTCDAWVVGGPITDESAPAEEPAEAMEQRFSPDEVKMRITAARIMGATAVPFPAFAEAYIEGTASLVAALMTERRASGGFASMLSTYADIDFAPPQGAREEAERGLAWRDEYGRGGTQVGVARARDIANGRNLSPDTIGRMVSYFARHEVDKQGTGWSPGEDGFPSAGRIAWALWGGDPGRTWAEKVQGQMRSRDESGSITAGATLAVAPLVPPRSWFSNPRFAAPSPIRVTDDGRVLGHVAVWGSCHIGITEQCVTPPSSATNYAHFLTGEVLLDDGSRVPVGQITLGTGHAPLGANAARAALHYDHTGSAVADVTAGEDEYGIWVSGALRPGVSPEQVRTLMASDVSGDWRRIGSGLELVAVLAVNVPGFGKVRVGMNDGLVASLVASIAVPEVDLGRVRARIAASIGRSPEQRRAELAQRVENLRKKN